METFGSAEKRLMRLGRKRQLASCFVLLPLLIVLCLVVDPNAANRESVVEEVSTTSNIFPLPQTVSFDEGLVVPIPT